MPPFVGLAPKAGHPPWFAWRAGFLGTAHGPFRPTGPSSADMKPVCDPRPASTAGNLFWPDSILSADP